MTKCISYWSVQGGGSGACPVPDALDQAKATGFDGIELCVGQTGVLTPETDEATCRGYAQMAAERGVRLDTVACGLSWACSPTSPDPAVRRRSVDQQAAALRRTAWLGARAMLFVPGAVVVPWDPGYAPVRYDLAVAWAREAVVELGQVAAEVGVDLAVENVWNGLFYSPIEFVDFIDGIDNPSVGAYFDVGNVLNHQQWPPHWIQLLGPRLRCVHLKDFKLAVGNLSGFCDLLDGDVPFAETMAALRGIGYDGTLTAEMMPPDPTLLERTSWAMDQILAM